MRSSLLKLLPIILEELVGDVSTKRFWRRYFHKLFSSSLQGFIFRRKSPKITDSNSDWTTRATTRTRPSSRSRTWPTRMRVPTGARSSTRTEREMPISTWNWLVFTIIFWKKWIVFHRKSSGFSSPTFVEKPQISSRDDGQVMVMEFRAKSILKPTFVWQKVRKLSIVFLGKWPFSQLAGRWNRCSVRSR